MRRRNWAVFLAAAVLAGLLAGCGGAGEERPGMVLTAAIQGSLATLDPIRAETAADQTVLAHLYENLMRRGVDASGDPATVPGMAKSYDTEENYDGTVTYTFRLRSVKWSDGTAVTAQDFVYAWQRLADPASQSPRSEILSIVAGYGEVCATGDVTKLQISAKNDSTLTVTLTGVCGWFLTDVCTDTATMPLRREAVQALKAAALDANERAAAKGETGTATWCSTGAALVTNGPYTVTGQSADAVELTASESYGGLASGPSLIHLRLVSSAEEGWSLYESEQADAVSPLPEARLAALAAEGDWTPTPELRTVTLLFNTASEPLIDPLVRRALARGIDRAALSASAGAAARPAEGLVPYGVPDSGQEDFRTAGGALIGCEAAEYETACEEARSLLAEAGYDSGRALGTLECLYAEGGEGAFAAQALSQMWSDALRLRVKPVAVTAGELARRLAAGDYTLAVTELRGWANDAVSFLAPWRSGGEGNVTGYGNSAYDTLLEIIAGASDETARHGCLHDAESLLLEECPLTPLYFTGTGWEARPGLAGVCRDARGWLSFADAAEVPEG